MKKNTSFIVLGLLAGIIILFHKQILRLFNKESNLGKRVGAQLGGALSAINNNDDNVSIGEKKPALKVENKFVPSLDVIKKAVEKTKKKAGAFSLTANQVGMSLPKKPAKVGSFSGPRSAGVAIMDGLESLKNIF